MALSDKELYEYAEKMVALGTEDNIEGFTAFVTEIDNTLSDEDKQRLLTLVAELKSTENDQDEVEYTEYQATNQDPDQPAA